LEHVTISEGILIVKIYWLEGAAEFPATGPPGGSPIHHVELRFSPTDQIVFAEGDVIRNRIGDRAGGRLNSSGKAWRETTGGISTYAHGIGDGKKVLIEL
jgi:hypothetical protein